MPKVFMSEKMMRAPVLSLCLCLAAVFFFVRETAADEINAGDIALSLLLKPHRLAPTPPPLFVPMVVIWEDGRILYGEYDNDSVLQSSWPTRSPWIHSWGKIDPKDVAALQQSVSDVFRLGKKNVYSGHQIIDCDTCFLRTKFDGGYFIANVAVSNPTGEPAGGPVPGLLIIQGKDTKSGEPLYHPAYHSAWKKTKETVVETGKLAVAKDAVPVNVVVEDTVLTVNSRDGTILLRQDFSEHLAPKRERVK